MDRRIDLGSGKHPVEGAVTVDKREANNPDRILDLEDPRWDLPSDHFDEIHLNHVAEHITRWESLFKEIYRIARDGARVYIRIPHPSLSLFSPDHVTHFTASSLLKHLQPSHQEYIGEVEFRLSEDELHLFHYNTTGLKRYLGRAVDAVINLPNVKGLFKFFLWGWVGGFEEQYIVLEVVK